MKYLAFFLLVFSFSAMSAQEAPIKSNTNTTIVNLEEKVVDTTVVFNKKKATFYLQDFGLEKISRAKHSQFVYKKPTKTIC